MYEDVPISNMPNKVRVIEYQNENVIPFQTVWLPRKILTLEMKVSGVFFYSFKNL